MKTTENQIKPDWLTRKEVASILRISKHTVRHWELRGLLTPARINGRTLRYRRNEVENLLDEGAR